MRLHESPSASRPVASRKPAAQEPRRPLLSLRQAPRSNTSLMNWSPEQILHYRKLFEECSSRSVRETAALCFDDCEFFPPVLPGAVAAAESALGCTLPDDLKELYSRTDGLLANYGTNLVMPLQEALRENESLRYSPDFRELYMPFTHMLVFGGAGNGDLFFYPIRADGSLARNVFIWDHESDSRSYFANSLKDLFLRHATEVADL